MNIFWLDPVWRGASAMLTSFSPGTNPRPPTIATIAPVSVFNDTIAASKPCWVSGRTSRACSAICWKLGIERRVDLQAAAVERRLALLERVAEDVGAVEQVVAQRLGVVGARQVGLVGPLRLGARRDLERVERGLALGLGHLAGVDEEIDDLGEAGAAAVGVVDRVVAGRRTHQPGEEGRLDERELVDGLAEVHLGGGLHAVGVVAEEHRVEVALEDLVLGVLVLEHHRVVDLQHLVTEVAVDAAEELVLGDLHA